MKKTIAMLVLLALAAALFVGCETGPGPETTEARPNTTEARQDTTEARPDTTGMKVALITDYADVDDKAYNQAAYEAALAWCEENEVDFTCYKPTGDSTAERVAMIDKAAAEGCKVLLMPGYAFAGAIAETVGNYPDVKYVALDVSEYDLQDAKGTGYDFSWEYPANLYACVYRAELAGYMAGYAAVRLGYTKLGFLAGIAVPEVVRYGYGFVQGVDAAAAELGNRPEIELKYGYDNTLCPGDVTAEAFKWYEAGTELIFSCGGNTCLEVAEAAKAAGGKLIGADVDLAPRIDAEYGAGMTVSSAVKGLAVTVRAQLDRIADGSFEGGRVETLGLVSENPTENYVQLPASTQWAEGKFTEADYKALVAALYKGEIKVSADTENAPDVEIAVQYLGNIK